MPKITFLGAGSTVFAKNVLGDSMLTRRCRMLNRAVRHRRPAPGGIPPHAGKPQPQLRRKTTIKAYLGVETARVACAAPTSGQCHPGRPV
jgi:alpha-galactosidase